MIAASQPKRTSADAGWHAFAAKHGSQGTEEFKAAKAWHLTFTTAMVIWPGDFWTFQSPGRGLT
jgi:hypothetical protein